MRYAKGFFSMLVAAAKDNLTLFLTFVALGYLTLHPRQYHEFANFGESVWRGIVNWSAALAGWDSWAMTALAWADMGLKGGYQVRLMIVSTMIGLTLSIAGRLLSALYRAIFR